MEYRQLLPEAGTVEIDERLASLELGRKATDRPYTVANFVSSIDGRATFRGRSGALGDDGDKAMFHGLREQVDAILVGTGTLRAERYGRVLGQQARRDRRTQRGLPAEPLVCTITRSGQVPTEIPLFQEPEARIVMFTAADELDLSGCKADVQVVRLDHSELTGTTALRRLREAYEIRSLLCEGGPSIFAALLAEGLVDELFLTVAPKLTGGGEGPAITTGPELPAPQSMSLAWVLEREDSLFLRYTLR